MKIVVPENKCFGCGACVDACPVNCIRLEPDMYGFLYPSVDEKSCIDCHQCEKVCPALNVNDKYDTLAAYAATALKREESKKSSSGGIFAVIANYVLEQKGVVYGTTFGENFETIVIGITEKVELHKLQGSKYVQSTMVGCFTAIKKQLKEGTYVVFCGTACQVAALKSFLGEIYENLFTMDLVCHGVPSNQLFLDYLKYIEKKYDNKIQTYIFRDKEQGQAPVGKLVFQDGKIKKENSYQSSYYSFFLKNVTFRDNCYTCPFATEQRVGDITLCDYWGVDVEEPEFLKEIKTKGLTGISGVLLNTDKGVSVFSKIQDRLFYKQTEPKKIARNNQNLQKPSNKSEETEEVRK